MSIMKNWEGLKIPFEKIDVATEKFKTCIGRGGYGWVYKGVLSIDGKDTTVAVKRLNEQFGQGLKEFLTEIQLLSGQEHPNLTSLLGYCDDGKEKIIVYEYAARGSLDRYIRRRNRDESYNTLTWLQRLKICADAARGLNHLHNHIGGHRTIIHRDIKSSNILIDENWVAKISDLGLSKLSATGFGMSLIVSNGCGTHGYCEPEYYTSGVVTKKSDVYSFGIVLFEVLCGRLCIIEPDYGFILSGKSVKEYYNNGNLVQIIDPSLREHMGSYSMTKFSEIAYRCLHDDREQRPSMDIVAKELEEALNVHNEEDTDENWEKRLPNDYPHLIKMSDIPLIYTTKKELYFLFRHGFLAKNGQLWFSTCKSTRGICSILPATHAISDKHWSYKYLETLSLPESRFKEVKKLGPDRCYELTYRLESFMFSPDHGDYACYLVFKLDDRDVLPNDEPIFNAVYFLGDNEIRIPILKPQEETGSSKTSDRISEELFHGWLERSWVEKRDDGWLEARLTKPLYKHHLENCEELKIELIECRSVNGIIVEGVEFRPVVVDRPYVVGINLHDDQEQGPAMDIVAEELEETLSIQNEEGIDDDEDEYWEKKLPDNYQRYIEMSDIPLNYSTKKELYLLFCHGFLAKKFYGQPWFSTCKSTRGICSILPCKRVLSKDPYYHYLKTLSLPESRFKEVKILGTDEAHKFTCKLESYMFSRDHYNYAWYLVFKLEDGYVLSNHGYIFKARYNLGGNSITSIRITLKKPKEESGSSKSIDERPGTSMHNYMDSETSCVEKRDDGWLEARLTKPLLKHHLEKLSEHLQVVICKVKDGSLKGIIVEGVEFRPVDVDDGSYVVETSIS